MRIAKPAPKRNANVAHAFDSTPIQMVHPTRSSMPFDGISISWWKWTRIIPKSAIPRSMSSAMILSEATGDFTASLRLWLFHLLHYSCVDECIQIFHNKLEWHRTVDRRHLVAYV